MIFGSISYINLLPFSIFLKKALQRTQEKQIIQYHQGVPSKINRLFKQRSIDAAFISSIESRHCSCTDLGIVADGAVYSVLVIKSEQMFDSDSASSNKLSQVLGLEGKVLIGDKALKYYLDGNKAVDLSLEWKKQTKLPFVFARLCYSGHKRRVEQLAKKFSRKRVKIPRYYLEKEAKQKGISSKDILWYLQHIDYKIGYKQNRALKLFLKKAKATKQ
ncbi:MAG TPA: hypothetical protein ENK87_02600 [Nitratifractor sp.]|nr:hypothetical protein [Nitratifractor sp.]HHD75012.1 hypothetical protein [Nitratifractor sp.]HHH20796.1 hypothetical protein [Nitratifractor sp.]